MVCDNSSPRAIVREGQKQAEDRGMNHDFEATVTITLKNALVAEKEGKRPTRIYSSNASTVRSRKQLQNKTGNTKISYNAEQADRTAFSRANTKMFAIENVKECLVFLQKKDPERSQQLRNGLTAQARNAEVARRIKDGSLAPITLKAKGIDYPKAVDSYWREQEVAYDVGDVKQMPPQWIWHAAKEWVEVEPRSLRSIRASTVSKLQELAEPEDKSDLGSTDPEGSVRNLHSQSNWNITKAYWSIAFIVIVVAVCGVVMYGSGGRLAMSGEIVVIVVIVTGVERRN